MAINKYPNITWANKSALRNLWMDVWHRIGIEWPKNRVISEKFIQRIYHADSSSLETICQLAKECGLKLINRIDEDEIELVAPGAEDYSVFSLRPIMMIVSVMTFLTWKGYLLQKQWIF